MLPTVFRPKSPKTYFSIDAINQILPCNVVNLLYWLSIIALGTLLITPLWVVTYLPLGDLPDHAGQIRAISEFEHYSDSYQLNWFTPYWMSYAVTLFFAQAFSVVTAIKIVLSLSLLSTVATCAWLIKNSGGCRYWVWLCFPIAFSYSLYWGFFSYVVATPVAFALFAYVAGSSDKSMSLKTFSITAFISLALFFSHALAWALAVCIATSILFINNSLKETLKKASAFVVILPIAAYWASLTNGKASSNASIEFGFILEHIWNGVSREVAYIYSDFEKRGLEVGHFERVKEAFAWSIGRASLWDFFALSVFLCIWPAIIGAKLSRNWRRWLPLLVSASAFMITPYSLFEAFYVYNRFAVFLIPMLLFIYEWPKIDRQMSVGRSGRYAMGFLVVFGLLSLNISIFKSFKQNDDDFKVILDLMEPDRRVMALMIDQDSKFRFSPPYMHFGMWYQAEKRGEMAPSFSHDPVAFNVPMRYKSEFWKFPSTWSPGEFDWHRHKGDRYDYFLVRANHPKQYIFRQARGQVRLIAKQGHWQLYGRTDEREDTPLKKNMAAR